MNRRSDSLLFEHVWVHWVFGFFFSTFADLAYDRILCLPRLSAAFCFAHWTKSSCFLTALIIEIKLLQGPFYRPPYPYYCLAHQRMWSVLITNCLSVFPFRVLTCSSSNGGETQAAPLGLGGCGGTEGAPAVWSAFCGIPWRKGKGWWFPEESRIPFFLSLARLLVLLVCPPVKECPCLSLGFSLGFNPRAWPGYSLFFPLFIPI